MIAAIKQNPNTLLDAPASLRKDPAVVLPAVEQDGYA